MDENNKLPTGWGDDDDDDYGFNSDNDESSAWGNSSSSFKKTDEESEKVNLPAAESGNYESQSNPETTRPTSSGTHVNGLPKSVNSSTPAYSPFGVESSKPKAVPILNAVIALLLVIVGVLGGMFFMKNKDDKSDNSKSDNTQSTTDSSTSANLEVKSSDIEKAANSVLLEMDEEGIDISGAYIIGEPRRACSYNIPDSFDVETFLSRITNYFELEDSYVWFVFIKDGNVVSAAIGESWDSTAFGSNQTLHELFYNAKDELQKYVDNTTTIAETTIAGTTTVAETTVVETQSAAISPSDPYAEIKQEILDSVDNEHYSGKNSHIENAPADMRFYNMSERYNMNVSSPTIYTGPGTDYSKIDVYSDFFWVYGENSDWYYVEWGEGNGAFSHCCYGYMSKSSNNSGSKYTEFDTSAAGSDFEFYSGYFTGCRVATQSGTLNLRAAPSTTAEVIIQMPKDAYVQVLGNNADWDYLSYTDNGTTYYGYASREYIK